MKNIEALKKNSQFKDVYQNGGFASNDLLILRYLKTDEPTARIGISVSKKVGNSVVRHRTIRLIRESYSAYKDRLKPGVDIVIIAKPEAKGKGLAEIKDAFSDLLKRRKLV